MMRYIGTFRAAPLSLSASAVEVLRAQVALRAGQAMDLVEPLDGEIAPHVKGSHDVGNPLDN